LQRKRAGLVPSGGPGLAISELADLWGVQRRRAVGIARDLIALGVLRSEETATGRGGSKPKRYWAVAA
jgi:hypothetical protein